MKDTYLSNDLDLDWTPPLATKAAGLNHGIRPRAKKHQPAPKPAQTAVKALRKSAPVAKPAPLAMPKPALGAEAKAPVRPRTQSAAPARSRGVKQQPAPKPVQPAQVPDTPVLQIPRWADLPFATAARNSDAAAAGPVQDAASDIASIRAFDQLRTKLRQVAKENGWTNIGITAPTPGCGTTFMATNLALSLSRIGASRTVLMDANLRRPGVAAALDLQAPGDLRSFLDGRVGLVDQVVRESETLAVIPNDRKEEDAAEVLQDRRTRHTLEQMRSALRPDMVIYDLPAMLTYDDVAAFLPELDALLIISDGTRTTAQELAECERLLDGHVPLLGVALNNARRTGTKE